ncbi:MAG: 50S ribosomal protein L6 [bacterium]|nr:50S ribosomal protein L6 [bacterium]
MSRIGKIPVPIPDGVNVAVTGPEVTVRGPKGALSRTFENRVRVKVSNGTCVVIPRDGERRTRAYHGLARALINNMVIGVSKGYSKTLKIVGVGYRALPRGKGIELQVGFSHTVSVPRPDGIDFQVPDATTIVVSGIDKELVGQTAAVIRRIRPPEPYKGKGIRYEGEYVQRKSGKTTGSVV